MTCVGCSIKNNFPYEYCCLLECGKHEYCLDCENLNKNRDLSHCKYDEKIYLNPVDAV